ncbi:three prime repair exonuclease 2-like [Bicyclus anynana]|uniref:Three prime repair exonuclease 2-like n=1 Tax=Bicyclus anynana TaxID=110368 RepID=A0A6J1MJ15_BICAN|nr:three prime repair exonuclease 2-like [Bicyclus anynana]
MTIIQTFVFFDLETTGIPAKTAKVTEITLISVSRSDIEQTDSGKLPAVNKLSLLCNPKKNIQTTAAKLTGLTNQFLKNQPIFKDNIKCINAFLDKPKPVCLVAHNGDRFDFKILQSEYLTANEYLPNDLMCLDTLNAFRNILKDPKYNYTNAVHNSISSLDESDRVSNGEEWQDLSVEEIQEIDELCERLMSTPNKVAKKTENHTPKTTNTNMESAPKVNYKLCTVYEQLLNKKVKECHRAEADCIMLLECAIATKRDFLNYADDKCKSIG